MIAVALMLFPILIIASLVLDLGFAGFLQSRLQTASDLAAREGPRGWRGPPTQSAWCSDVADPSCDPAVQATAWDTNRRNVARSQVAALHAPGAAGAPRVGAPRVATLTLGGDLSLPDPSALALINGEAPTFGGASPLATNSGDAPDGDLVGGRFLGRGATPVVSCHDPDVLEAFGENCAYERSDFAPSSTSPGENRAFLARLRMTGEDATPGVSQPEIALPVLFGRFVGTPGDPSAPPLRTRGLRVRSVAIADARPALAAAAPTPGGQGVANFGVDVAVWRTLSPDVAVPISEDPATGLLTLASVTAGGRVLATPDAVGLALGAAALAVPGSVVQPEPGAPTTRYVPLYRVALDGVERTIGFGVADLAPGTPPLLTKRRSRVEAQGLSAAPDLQQTLGTLASAVIDDLFAEYREARACDPADDALALACAGVLVR